jgi:hypothetical protein
MGIMILNPMTPIIPITLIIVRLNAYTGHRDIL